MRLENSFIGARGVGEKTERSLWERGVTHWDDVEDGVLGGKRGQNLREFVRTARPKLREGDADFFAGALPSGEGWRLAENFRDSTCFFDIETTGLSQHSSVVTTVSLHRGGETTTLVRGQDLTREALRAELDAADVLVSFNGKRFDVPFLEGKFDLDVTTPHLDLMYPCRRLDLTGGLKAVEQAVGIGRDSGVDGREAVRLWHRYEGGDDAALDRLVHYNRLDARNLATLMDRVTDRLHDEVFEPYASG
ncbi:exonuclease [Halobacteriales archaeon QS_1_68_20]|nr:MAG: exonuclease [Halobacteriales archaeon QS_1_68_20]